MEQTPILNENQKRFLEHLVKEPYFLERYYWTGGTVLSKFYLRHRESYDLDLFTEEAEVHLPSVEKFVGITGRKLGAQKIVHRRFLGLHTFIFELEKDELKVDFNYYPFLRISKGKKWRNLEIDSLEDIAVNKVHTLSMKPRERDFVDLYFILKKRRLDLKRLISLAKIKFDWHIDPLQLGGVFTEVVAYKDVPKMLVPFNRKDMENFFLKLAKDLGREVFK